MKERFSNQGISPAPQPIVFALRPRADLVSKEYILESPDPAVAPIWRRYMNPGVPDGWVVDPQLDSSTGALPPERYTYLCLDFKRGDELLGGCSRVIDEHGNAVDEEWRWNDRLKMRRAELLGDFNPQLTDAPPTTVFQPRPKPTPAGP